jgi:iron complex outermembrane receptor protein
LHGQTESGHHLHELGFDLDGQARLFSAMALALLNARRTPLFFLVAIILGMGHAAADSGDSDSLSSLASLSIEDLMNQEVTTVTRTPEKLSEVPSAIQVLRGNDIRRSAATTLPEALRLAPNLEVAQQNSHTWGISARGFNGAPIFGDPLANKLLVMIDGRAVYSPLFGGVFWNAQNPMLEDLDRIEVVSGPGTAMWGSNAVNGVINVVSKSARDTQGMYVSGAGGSWMQDQAEARYGGKIGENFYYRIYGERFDRDSTDLTDGTDGDDSWNNSQGGFRTDYDADSADVITVQGDLYGQSTGAVEPSQGKTDGQNVLGRWTHTFSATSDLRIQSYFDRVYQADHAQGFTDQLTTGDFDIQHRFAVNDCNEFLWGGSYRYINDRGANSPLFTFVPTNRDLQLFSVFAQNETEIIPDTLKLTLAGRFEHNDYSAGEFQPTARLAWMPTENQTVWTAVSRATRSPTRLDADLATQLFGSSKDGFDSEKVIAYEAGYRVRPTERSTVSLAAYYNDYTDLRGAEFNTMPPPPQINIGNFQHAKTWGVELSGEYQALEHWRVRGGYTYLNKNLTSTNDLLVPASSAVEANDPSNQVVIQSILDITDQLQFDLVTRYVSSLPAVTLSVPGLSIPRVPGYYGLDLRLAWHYEGLEFSVVGQNLIGGQHREMGMNEIPRAVYGRVTWRMR